MDPLSVAASSAGLLGLCIHLSKTISGFIQGSRQVDISLQALQSEIDGLREVLTCIETSFKDPQYADAALKATTGHEKLHWKSVETSMINCESTLTDLIKVLDRVKKGNSFAILNRAIKQIKLSINTSEISAYKQLIQHYKETMQLSLQIITV